jgi:xanthine/CO dehydrogenase XdhC/CoxF family maturation factor
MNEIRKIVHLFKSLNLHENRVALATVVKVHGSAYRRPGARMLITESGQWIGTISGGCLEGDALKQAVLCISENKPMLVTYDTRDESAAKVGANLGCNGIIDVLLEPIDRQSDIIHFLMSYVDDNVQKGHAVIFKGDEREVGRHFYSSELNDNSTLTHIINEGINKAISTGTSFIKEEQIDDMTFEVFYETLKPNIHLILFGSGLDSYPIIKIAKILGWDVTVTSDSYSITAKENFECADKIIYCDRDEILDHIKIDNRTYCLLISHNFKYDYHVMKSLIQTDTPYIGILGPKKRLEKISEELNANGIELNDELLGRIHNPSGMDIGGDTPEEIALSMLAEIQAVINSKPGGMLKYKSGRIHE